MKPHTFDSDSPLDRDTATPLTLEERLDAAEYRLSRALLCVDRHQKELAELRRGLRAAAQEQSAFRTQQARRFRLTGVGFAVLLLLLFAAEAVPLARLVWRLLSALASLLGTETELAAGVLLSGLITTLTFLLIRAAVRRWAARREGQHPSGDNQE